MHSEKVKHTTGKGPSMPYMAAVADNDVGQRTEPDPEPDQLSMMKVKIVCDNGTVNIRVGNGTDYARITAVPDGTEFPSIFQVDL